MLTRDVQKDIQDAFRINPVVALLGPRQCGKTTTARKLAKSQKLEAHFFDLEDPRDLAQLQNPVLALDELKGFIVIDEIQRVPEIFPYLRTLVDKQKRRIKILILGSASQALIKQSSESLAGRISYIEMTPFHVTEVPDLDRLHLRGGFPLSYLSRNEVLSFRWRMDYITTFLERDLFEFGFRIPSATMRRFWMMLTHYHGQTLNYSELARSFGISDMTVRRYLEVLTQTFMIRLLSPWHENLSKRQVKAPKLYIRDSGIYHGLLGAENLKSLKSHPKLGASWEGFALEQVLSVKGIRSEEAFFWGTHNQTELDLLTFEGVERVGYEFKFADTPTLTKSMHIAMADLKLDRLFVVTPQVRKHKLASSIIAISLADFLRRPHVR